MAIRTFLFTYLKKIAKWLFITILALALFLWALSALQFPDKKESKGPFSYKQYHVSAFIGEAGSRHWCTVKVEGRRFKPPPHFDNRPKGKIKRCWFVDAPEPLLIYQTYNDQAGEFGEHLLWMKDGKVETVYLGRAERIRALPEALTWNKSCFLNLKTGMGGDRDSSRVKNPCLPLQGTEPVITYHRINDAIRNDARLLNLSYRQTTSLSPEIGRLRNLRKLDLSGNRLPSLPAEIGALGELETLDLNGNWGLETLPPEIGQLKKLKWIDLTNTNMLTLPHEMGGLTSLEEIRLGGTRIPETEIQALRQKLPNCCFLLRTSTCEGE